EGKDIRPHESDKRRQDIAAIEQLRPGRAGHAGEQERGEKPVKNQPGDQKAVGMVKRLAPSGDKAERNDKGDRNEGAYDLTCDLIQYVAAHSSLVEANADVTASKRHSFVATIRGMASETAVGESVARITTGR